MVIGIDLGTTYSAISILDEQGNPQIILNKENEPTTPSVVAIDKDEVFVGKNAWKKILSIPQKIFRCIKRKMGLRETVYKEGNTEFSPEAVSGFIVRSLLQDVLARTTKNVTGIVVTVPTYFSDTKRMSTKHAVEGAVDALKNGKKEVAERLETVEFVELIDEPKAAALYYGHCSKRNVGNVLIYDLGGGTFDAALVELKEGGIRVIAEAEEHEAGGAHFDNKICDYVMDYLKENYQVNLREDKYAMERAALQLDAELCKWELSKENVTEAMLTVRCNRKTIDVVVYKADFERMIAAMVKRTEYAVLNMLEDKDMATTDVDEVVLVGGSSRVPCVREMLKRHFGAGLSEAVDPDLAVVYGAALYAGIRKKTLEASTEREGAASVEMEDICVHSIGLLMTNPITGEKHNDVVIPENTPIVAEVTKYYETAYVRQTYIKLELTESGSVISEQYIGLPQGLPQGTRVDVKIRVSSSHLIEVYLYIPAIQFKSECNINRLDNLSEEEQKELSGLIESKLLR